jgi:hypothetical protein
MNDWEALQVVSSSLARPAEYARKRAFEIKDRLLGGKAMPWGMEFFLVSMQVRQALGKKITPEDLRESLINLIQRIVLYLQLLPKLTNELPKYSGKR